MGYIWEFNTHGDIFTYDDITVKASELCWRDDNGKLNTIKDGKISLAYMDDNNIIRDKDGGDKVVAPRALLLGSEYITVKNNFNIVNGKFYKVNTTDNSIVGTLPENPDNNFIAWFLDIAGTFDTNNLTLSRGNEDHKIMGEKNDSNIDKKNYFFGLIYSDGDWRIL